MSFLFGSKPKTEIETRSTLSPEQQALMSRLFGELSGGPVIPQFEQYTGNRIEGLTDAQLRSLSGMEQRALQLSQTGGVDPMVQQYLMKALEGGEDLGSDEYIKRNIEDPAARYMQEQLLPQLTQRFSGNAAFGSDRKEMESRALRDLMTEVLRNRSDVKFKAGQERNATRGSALNSAAALQQVGSQELSQLFANLDLPRGVGQARLDADYQEFLRGQGYKDTALQTAMQLLGVPAIENIAKTTGGSSGFLSTLVGAAGTIFGGPAGAAAIGALTAANAAKKK